MRYDVSAIIQRSLSPYLEVLINSLDRVFLVKLDDIATSYTCSHEYNDNSQRNPEARYRVRHGKHRKNLHKLCRYSVVKC